MQECECAAIIENASHSQNSLNPSYYAPNKTISGVLAEFNIVLTQRCNHGETCWLKMNFYCPAINFPPFHYANLCQILPKSTTVESYIEFGRAKNYQL